MSDCPTDAGISAHRLNCLEVTGRAATHVHDVAGLGCMHSQAGQALLALRNEACTAGIDLRVVSAFRDFNRQLAIWRAKFNGERPVLDALGIPLQRAQLYESAWIDAILTWSALPGASRHHWGSDLDVIDGAALPYASDRGGVRPEPWHLSYAPVAVPALTVLSLDVLREALSETDMPGRETVLVRLPELYERYVLAVDRPP